MIKKHLPFHLFKKIDESIIPEMMEAEGTCITFDLPSLEEMISNAEEGENKHYYYDSNCEVHFYLSKYKEEPITVFFTVHLTFNETYDPGDYFQPPEHEVINEDLNIWVEDIMMENYNVDINLGSDEIKKLENFIAELLTD